jgi:tetratricopeptide (TPR) repeat protein
MLASCFVGLAGGGLWWSRRDPYVVRQLEVGRGHLRQKDYPAAIGCYSRVLERDPNEPQALFERGRCYVHGRQFMAAREDFHHCAELTQDGRAWAAAAYCTLRVNDYFLDGVSYGGRAREQGFVTAEVLSNLAYCHLMLGAFAPARKHCEEALQLRSRFPAAAHISALVDLRQSLQLPRQSPALALIERALTLCPPSAELSLDAACVYVQAARCTKPADGRERFLGHALSHLRSARRTGMADEQFDAMLKILPELERDDRFQAIRSLPAVPRRHPVPDLLADPLVGQDEF